MSKCAIRRSAVLAVAALVASALPLRGADFEVKATEAPPPGEVSAAVRVAVGAGSLEVLGGGGAVAEFWLRDSLPVEEGAPDALGVIFPGLEPGVLVGVVRIARPWREYKDLVVPPGVYTMRYALRPSDGNHMGVSTYRDFLLLVPAGEDTEVDVAWTSKELYGRSMLATKQPHPATLALFPVWDPIEEATIVENDAGQPMLAVPLGNLVLGLVVEGHGEA